MARKIKTRGHLKALLKVENPLCGICGGRIMSVQEATVDHIIPISKGGSNLRHNVQLAHPKCNRRKADNLNYQPKSPPQQKKLLNDLELA